MNCCECPIYAMTELFGRLPNDFYGAYKLRFDYYPHPRFATSKKSTIRLKENKGTYY